MDLANDIVTGLFQFLIDLIINLVNILLLPIDTIIETFFPSISDGINYVAAFFNYILQFIPWIMSWFHLPPFFLKLVFEFYFFKLTVPLLVHTVKLALQWYDKVKL